MASNDKGYRRGAVDKTKETWVIVGHEDSSPPARSSRTDTSDAAQQEDNPARKRSVRFTLPQPRLRKDEAPAWEHRLVCNDAFKCSQSIEAQLLKDAAQPILRGCRHPFGRKAEKAAVDHDHDYASRGAEPAAIDHDFTEAGSAAARRIQHLARPGFSVWPGAQPNLHVSVLVYWFWKLLFLHSKSTFDAKCYLKWSRLTDQLNFLDIQGLFQGKFIIVNQRKVLDDISDFHDSVRSSYRAFNLLSEKCCLVTDCLIESRGKLWLDEKDSNVSSEHNYLLTFELERKWASGPRYMYSERRWVITTVILDKLDQHTVG
eukprot:scpid63671/ scgid23823/ 